jgi:hypothetical protein
MPIWHQSSIVLENVPAYTAHLDRAKRPDTAVAPLASKFPSKTNVSSRLNLASHCCDTQKTIVGGKATPT